MQTDLEITVSPAEAENPDALKGIVARELRAEPEEITEVRVRRSSIDARARPVVMKLRVSVWRNELPPEEAPPRPEYPEVTSDRRVIIVGCGPAGMFAALRLIEMNVRPIIVERGKDVQARRRDLASVQKKGTVNPDSNYCFGEGGAGTYSDGKLYTRAKKRGNVSDVYRALVAHGAPERILVDAHPHIGSNILPKVVQSMRASIIEAGGEVHFEERVDRFLRNESGEITGVGTNSGGEFFGEAVILATGHSARDIFTLLDEESVTIEAKPFAVGVRLEHPQPLIDSIQYHQSVRPEGLPAARYRITSNVEERGIFSFCMCPGGFIVPAATENDEVVVNGMSLSKRDSPFANSGIIVSVEPEDLEGDIVADPLIGMRFQKSLEIANAKAGGGMQRAAGQRMTDFVERRVSSTLPSTSYHPGVTSFDLHELLPHGIAMRLKIALKEFGEKMRGYMTEEGLMVAVESRTSSPIRIPRDEFRFSHPEHRRLFPCGEGAGYAGGIMSAALDGIRVANRVAEIEEF